MEFAVPQFLLLDEQVFGRANVIASTCSAMGGRICARVACDEHVCGQVGKRHVVSTHGQKLAE